MRIINKVMMLCLTLCINSQIFSFQQKNRMQGKNKKQSTQPSVTIQSENGYRNNRHGKKNTHSNVNHPAAVTAGAISVHNTNQQELQQEQIANALAAQQAYYNNNNQTNSNGATSSTSV